MTSSEAFTGMTCRELKLELNKRDLPTTGLKKDLLQRLHEAEKATLTDDVKIADDTGRADTCFEVQPTVRRSKSGRKFLCLTVLCVGLFFALRHLVLKRYSVSGPGNRGDGKSPTSEPVRRITTR